MLRGRVRCRPHRSARWSRGLAGRRAYVAAMSVRSFIVRLVRRRPLAAKDLAASPAVRRPFDARRKLEARRSDAAADVTDVGSIAAQERCDPLNPVLIDPGPEAFARRGDVHGDFKRDAASRSSQERKVTPSTAPAASDTARRMNATPHQRAQFLRLFDDLVAEDGGRGAIGRVAEFLGISREHVSRVRKDPDHELSRNALMRAASAVGIPMRYFDDATGRSYQDFKADQRSGPSALQGSPTSLGEVAATAEQLWMTAGDPVELERLSLVLAKQVLALDIIQRADRILASTDPNDRSGDGVSLALKIRDAIPRVTPATKKK